MSGSSMWLSIGAWPWLWTAFLAERVSSLWVGPLTAWPQSGRGPASAWLPRAVATGLLGVDLALATWCVTQLELPPPLEGLALVQPRWAALALCVLALAGCMRLWRRLWARLEASGATAPAPLAAALPAAVTSHLTPLSLNESNATDASASAAAARTVGFRLGTLSLTRSPS